MKVLIALMMLATPALAQDAPYMVGDTLVLTHLMDTAGNVLPNPLPASEQACFEVEAISPNTLGLLLVSGYYDMNQPRDPLFADMPQLAPTQAPVATRMTFATTTSTIWGPCERSTWLTTASTTCNMQRLFELVPDCSGRPLPPA